LLLVLGDYGVGKTRMAQALIDSLDDADDICFLEGQINSSYHSLFSEVLEQFDLLDEEAFINFSRKISDQAGIAVIIVDDAHHLTDEVLLELISLIQSDFESRVHLVLFAEPHLLNRVEQFDLPEITLTDFYLEKFSLNETVDYLNFRMEMADYLGPEIFTESKVEPWWRQSQGQLLPLHELAQERLLSTVSAARTFNKNTLPIPHIIGASVLGAGLIFGFIYWGGESSHKDVAQVTTSIPVAKTNEPIATLPQVTVTSSPANVALESAGATALENSDVAKPLTNTAGVSSSISGSNFSSAAEKNSEVAVVKQSVVPLVKTNSLPQDSVVKSEKLNNIASAATVKKSELVIETKTATNAKTKTEVSNPEKQKNAVRSDDYSDQERTILSWNDSEFTLQLVGVSTEKAVREFVAEQPYNRDLLIFKSLRHGKDWFVVVTGRYPSSAKARQAIESLPEPQKKASPWPRDLKAIQKEIKSR
jgi:DamX protein